MFIKTLQFFLLWNLIMEGGHLKVGGILDLSKYSMEAHLQSWEPGLQQMQ